MTINTHQLERNDGVPNNDCFPLLVYAGAFPGRISPGDVEEHIRENRWYNSWRNGVFPYHHYHATVHEILVCYGGEARVQFGGEGGPTIAISAGDAVLIPAGVGHKRISSDQGFAVIGAYLDGASWDLQRPESADIEASIRAVADCGKPPADPITGTSGGLLDLW